MECAGNACRRGSRGAVTVASHRQANQCRVPKRSFDPAGQYHDARTANCGGPSCTAPARGKCPNVPAAPVTCAGRAQEAGNAKSQGGSASSAFTGSRGAGSRRDQRLILPNADAES